MNDDIWMIRAGKGGTLFEHFTEQNVVAINFGADKKFANGVSKEDLAKIITKANPGEKRGALRTWTAQAFRFLNDVKVGDIVVTYSPEIREYYIGAVKTGYEYQPSLIPQYPHVLRVNWHSHVGREDLAVGTRNTLGAIQTIFRINDTAFADMKSHAVPSDQPLPLVSRTAPIDEDDQTPTELLNETVEKANEFLADRIDRLSWDDMQELVAGLLRAMGYQTKVSPTGPDRGFDVFASPDGLGLQDPRIFVEVKHRKVAMGAPDIRSFLGGRQQGDRCLYVSTNGFTKDAKYEADRSSIPLRLLALKDLATLVAERYENLDDKTRALVRLQKIYWPVD